MGTVVLGANIGCHQGVYKASKLPPQYAAPVVRSADWIDLSHLATNTGNNELIQPGDVLEVSILTGLEKASPVRWSLRVDQHGIVNVPLVGPVVVAGMDPGEADQKICEQSVRMGIYRNPEVSVLFGKRHTRMVTVAGAVKKPGTYEVPATSGNVLAALTAAGGLDASADNVIEVRHPGHRHLVQHANNASPDDIELSGFSVSDAATTETADSTVRIDLVQASTSEVEKDYHIEDGSVVFVAKRPPREIYVMGLVRKAGTFELPPDGDLHLLDAIALAGGRTYEIADRVRVIRNHPNGGEPIVIDVSIRSAKHNQQENIRVATGDVISVEETPATFFIDTIPKFLRFGMSAAIPGI